MSAKRGVRTADSGVVVIGLGRFGSQVADALLRLGHEVLAVDSDPHTVERLSSHFTHVVQADATDEAALRQLGVADFQRVVVTIGSAIEASVLTVLAVAEIGVPEIWGRATSERHAKILSSVGANHVIFPEAAIAERIAHLIVSHLLDFARIEDDLAVATTRTPRSLAGRRLGDIDVRDRYGVVVIGMKRPGEPFAPAQPETVVSADCFLVVEGSIDQVQRFATAD